MLPRRINITILFVLIVVTGLTLIYVEIYYPPLKLKDITLDSDNKLLDSLKNSLTIENKEDRIEQVRAEALLELKTKGVEKKIKLAKLRESFRYKFKPYYKALSAVLIISSISLTAILLLPLVRKSKRLKFTDKKPLFAMLCSLGLSFVAGLYAKSVLIGIGIFIFLFCLLLWTDIVINKKDRDPQGIPDKSKEN